MILYNKFFFCAAVFSFFNQIIRFQVSHGFATCLTVEAEAPGEAGLPELGVSVFLSLMGLDSYFHVFQILSSTSNH